MRILLLAGILGSAAVAQSLNDPPPIVQLVRKPGTGGASLKAYANVGAAREHLLFRVEPRISYVSSDFADVDPEFWRGKVK